MASTPFATGKPSRPRVRPFLWAALCAVVVIAAAIVVIYPAHQAARGAARSRTLRADLLADTTASERLDEMRGMSSSARAAALAGEPSIDRMPGGAVWNGPGAFGAPYGSSFGSRTFLRFAASGGADAVRAEIDQREVTLGLLDLALDEALTSLSPGSPAGAYYSRDDIVAQAYAAASVADAVCGYDQAAYLAEGIAVARLCALNLVRGQHGDPADASELARALDDMLLEQNRAWSDMSQEAWSPESDTVLAGLLSDPDERVRVAAQCRIVDSGAERRLEVVRACEPVAERMREALLADGQSDPRGALGYRPVLRDATREDGESRQSDG